MNDRGVGGVDSVDGTGGRAPGAAGRYALEEALDGELSPQLAERLARHLETCPECAAEVERVRRIKELVRRSCADQSAPPALRERITVEYRRVSVTVRRTAGGA